MVCAALQASCTSFFGNATKSTPRGDKLLQGRHAFVLHSNALLWHHSQTRAQTSFKMNQNRALVAVAASAGVAVGFAISRCDAHEKFCRLLSMSTNKFISGHSRLFQHHLHAACRAVGRRELSRILRTNAGLAATQQQRSLITCLSHNGHGHLFRHWAPAGRYGAATHAFLLIASKARIAPTLRNVNSSSSRLCCSITRTCYR